MQSSHWTRFQLQQEEFDCFHHVALDLELRRQEKMMWKPPCLRKAIVARHVLEVSLHGDLEGSLSKNVKVKPGLHWRPQDIGDAKAKR